MGPEATFTCDVCGREFPTLQGQRTHTARSHTSKVSNTPDALFEKLAAATAALYPNGVPFIDIIEVAEWQKVTLRLLSRK